MAWYDIFTGGVVKEISALASEWIETDKESAEAKAIMVKAIDPNGKMRRDISTFTCRAYGFYLVATGVLIFMSVWSVGGESCEIINNIKICTSKADIAAGRLTELFLPFTGVYGAIVSASFGVNATNSIKGRP